MLVQIYPEKKKIMKKKLLNQEQRSALMQIPTQSRYQSHKAHETANSRFEVDAEKSL